MRRWALRSPIYRIPELPPPPKIPPYPVEGTGISDFYAFLVNTLYGIHPALRSGHVAWVMDPGWATEVTNLARHLATHTHGAEARDPVTEMDPEAANLHLLGYPAVVTPLGGFPHLEPIETAATHPPPTRGWYPSPRVHLVGPG